MRCSIVVLYIALLAKFPIFFRLIFLSKFAVFNHVRCCLVHFRDAGGVQHTLQQLRVLFHPLSSTPTQPTLARKLLSDVVAGALPASDGVGTADVMTAGQYDLQLSGTHTQTQRIPCSKAAP